MSISSCCLSACLFQTGVGLLIGPFESSPTATKNFCFCLVSGRLFAICQLVFEVGIFRRPIYLKNYCGIAKSNHFESALLALSIYQKSSFVCVLFASFADEAALRSWDVFVFMWKMFLQFDCAILRIRKREMNSVWNSARSSVDLNVIDMWHEASYFITYPAERSVVF